MSLGNRDSYYKDFEINNLPKGEKGKTSHTHSDDLSALFKNSIKNSSTGLVVGQKRPITNNDVVITLRQKFLIIRIRPRACLTLK